MTTYPRSFAGLVALPWLLLAGCEGSAGSAGDAQERFDVAPAEAAAGPLDAAAGDPLTLQPFVSAAGIGVSDLEVSTKFYAEVFGLKTLYTLDTPYWKETVLEDVRGNHVVTMDFVRERNTKKNPAKLVFAVGNASDYYARVLAAGGSETSPPSPPEAFLGTEVALTYDPDGYLVELIEVPTVPAPVLVGVGIGVSDLEIAADYYTRVLDLRFVRDIDVPGFMDEKELGSRLMRGPSVVLMHYEDETRSYADVPVKLVLSVPDAAAFAAAVRRDDPAKILQAPAPFGDSDVVVGMARDHDGYLIEILEDRRGATDAGAPPSEADVPAP